MGKLAPKQQGERQGEAGHVAERLREARFALVETVPSPSHAEQKGQVSPPFQRDAGSLTPPRCRPKGVGNGVRVRLHGAWRRKEHGER